MIKFMGKNKGYALGALLAMLLSLLLLCGGAALATDAQQIQSTIRDINKKKEALQKEIDRIRGMKQDLEKYLEELDTALVASQDRLGALEEEKQELSLLVSEGAAQMEVVEQELSRRHDDMKLRIQYMYEADRWVLLADALSAGSLAELLNNVEYMTQMAGYDRQMLDEYAAVCAQLEEVCGRHRERLTQLEQRMAEEAVEQEALEALRSEKSAGLEQYKDELADQEDVMAGYDERLREQKELLAKVEANGLGSGSGGETGTGSDSGTGTGSGQIQGPVTYMWPLPMSRRITSPFGYRSSPTAGATTYHEGIDIGRPPSGESINGAPIVATAGGTVTLSKYSKTAGNYIIIDHGGGVRSVYMHCSKRLVSVGDVVRQGQTIANVGSTGTSTAPHLHFGLSINGTYVDPMDYLS